MSTTPNRRLRWPLLISLGLNVALITVLLFLAADRFSPDHGRHGGRMGLPNPRLLMSALPEERRATLDALYNEHRQGVRAAMRERRQARRQVRELMLAEEFDPDRIALAFAELRDKDERAAQAVQAMLIELLSELTPEERMRIAELVPQRHRHRHRKGTEAPAEAQSAQQETAAESSGAAQ